MANNYIYVNGVLTKNIYTNGVKMENAYANGILVYTSYVPTWKTVWTGNNISFSSSRTIPAQDFVDAGFDVDFSRPTKITANVTYDKGGPNPGTGNQSVTSKEISGDTLLFSDGYEDYSIPYVWLMVVRVKAVNTVPPGGLNFSLSNTIEAMGNVQNKNVTVKITKLEQFF